VLPELYSLRPSLSPSTKLYLVSYYRFAFDICGIRLARKQYISTNETYSTIEELMDVDELYWRNEACPRPCHCCTFVSLSFLIWWPPALVDKHLSFVIEITEQTPRTSQDDAHPHFPKRSCACLTPVGTLCARLRLRASSSNRSPIGIVWCAKKCQPKSRIRIECLAADHPCQFAAGSKIGHYNKLFVLNGGSCEWTGRQEDVCPNRVRCYQLQR